MFKGDRTQFGSGQLAVMEKRKKQSMHIKDPDEIADNLQKSTAGSAEEIYFTYCGACHLNNGKGDGTRFPPLDSSEWVLGDKTKLTGILINGLREPIMVKGKQFNNLMPSHSFLNDSELAMVLTYIRKNFGNNAGEITEEEVAAVRNVSKTVAK